MKLGGKSAERSAETGNKEDTIHSVVKRKGER